MLVIALKILFYCFDMFSYFKAQKEIESLVKQEDHLVISREKLRIKRERYLQTLSLLCGKAFFQTVELFFFYIYIYPSIYTFLYIHTDQQHSLFKYINPTHLQITF